MVVGLDGQPIYWHVPAGRTVTAIPDSRALWLVLWENRERLLGVAHTHPAGLLRPSMTDLRTFAACEDGLGVRLRWWIVTPDRVGVCRFVVGGDGETGQYVCEPDGDAHVWLSELRRRSWAADDSGVEDGRGE